MMAICDEQEHSPKDRRGWVPRLSIRDTVRLQSPECGLQGTYTFAMHETADDIIELCDSG